jgi:hypothetical protein
VNKPFPPALAQVFIWLGAIVLVAVVAGIALTLNRPQPVPPPPSEPAPPPAASQPTESVQPPDLPEPPQPTVAEGSGLVPPPSGPDSGARPLAEVQPSTPGPRRPHSFGTSAAAAPRRPAQLTEDLYIDIAARMLLVAQATPGDANAQAAMEKQLGKLLTQRGIGEADFRAYSARVEADPKERERIKNLVLLQANRLRMTPPAARTAPGLGTPPKSGTGTS